ncbi:hypothetical protein C8F01DRAFT_463056 [Mycena amicta]|nr:hypothetical protein C8F01DRAFT_463056 [Mycena amicta]
MSPSSSRRVRVPSPEATSDARSPLEALKDVVAIGHRTGHPSQDLSVGLCLLSRSPAFPPPDVPILDTSGNRLTRAGCASVVTNAIRQHGMPLPERAPATLFLFVLLESGQPFSLGKRDFIGAEEAWVESLFRLPDSENAEFLDTHILPSPSPLRPFHVLVKWWPSCGPATTANANGENIQALRPGMCEHMLCTHGTGMDYHRIRRSLWLGPRYPSSTRRSSSASPFHCHIRLRLVPRSRSSPQANPSSGT